MLNLIVHEVDRIPNDLDVALCVKIIQKNVVRGNVRAMIVVWTSLI